MENSASISEVYPATNCLQFDKAQCNPRRSREHALLLAPIHTGDTYF